MADMRPDDLLSGSLLAENGIREPLYLTAMRYAGIAVTPEKHPAHIDSVVLDKADTARLHSWFQAEPLPAPKPAPEPLLEVRNLCFGYNKGQHTLQKRQLFHRQGRDGQHRGSQRRGQIHAVQADLRV